MQLDVAQAELDIYREKHTRCERQLQEAQSQLKTVKTSLKEDKRLEYRGVSFQRVVCTGFNGVPIREVSLFLRVVCIGFNGVGT